MRRVWRRLGLVTVASLVVSSVGTLGLSPEAGAYSSDLTRAPYLTDMTSSAVMVNFGTTTGIVKVRVRYGSAAGGACDATETTASTTTRTRYTVTYPSGSGTASFTANQWQVPIASLSPSTYCYRLEGATNSGSTTYSDLLGASTQSPTFTTSPASTFAVLGDFGQTGSAAPDFVNVFQKNVISQLSGSGAAFAISTGDIGYPSGSQSNYGDLLHTGQDVSGVFGPDYWPVAGDSLPLYPVPGNHGFTSTFTSLWPSTSVASASAGKASNGTYSVNGSTVTAPDYWYAFNVSGWRIYNLTSAWSTAVTTGSTDYEEDYKQHWSPGSAERSWLTNDLAANPNKPKIAVFHYPLYSAVHHGDVQDPFLTAPPDGSQSLESLLASNNVKLALNGHSHVYNRNNPHLGMVSIISGGGGAKLSPVDSGTKTKCAQTYPDTGERVVAFARGWSSSGGSGCNTAQPTSMEQVYHFLRVRLNPGSASVDAIDSTGATFDTTTVSGSVTGGDTTPPTASGAPTASATTATATTLDWTAATDDVAVTGYDVLRDDAVVGSVDGATTTYTDSTLSPATTYRYTVRAKDGAGNLSPPSPATTVTTPPAPDTTPPTAPGAPTASATTATATTLDWTAATDDVAVTGYDVLRDDAVVGSVDGATTTYTDSTLSPATTYRYTVRAKDGAGNLSPPSPATTVTTPLFTDGFETGDLRSWSASSGMAVQSQVVASGSFAARQTSTGTPTWAYKSLPATYTDLWARARFLRVSSSTSVALVGFRRSTGASILYVYLNAQGKVSVRNDAGAVTTTSNLVIAPGTWHTVVAHAVIGGAGGQFEISIDGTVVPGLSLSGQNLGSTPIGRFQIGEASTGRTYDVGLDDVAVSTTPLS